MKTALRLLLIGCVGAAGCGSPEAIRARGGRGADVQNRPKVVEMHEGSRPFWNTPNRIGAVQHPPLEPAAQANTLSRP